MRGIAVQFRHGFRGQKHKALALRFVLGDRLGALLILDDGQGLVQVAVERRVFERRFRGPQMVGRQGCRTLGVVPGGFMLPFALCLEEQAAQAERAGLVVLQHLIEQTPRLVVLVFGERGLRFQK